MVNEQPQEDKTDAQRLLDVLERIARALERTATVQNEATSLRRQVATLKAQRQQLVESLKNTADALEQATQGRRGGQARPRLGTHPIVREARVEIGRTT
jgi:uncharacterized phage infection (PIP) family protein YhgE